MGCTFFGLLLLSVVAIVGFVKFIKIDWFSIMSDVEDDFMCEEEEDYGLVCAKILFH